MSFKRTIYLKMKTLKEARDILFQGFSDLAPLSVEQIPVPEAVGRVLAKKLDRKFIELDLLIEQQAGKRCE